MSTLLQENSYKEAIYHRLQHERANGKKLTLRHLAERIPVQYTYLSKVLRSDQFHLSEDQIFRLADALDLNSEELDYLLLLRAYEASQVPARKKILKQKIDRLQTAHQLEARALQPMNERFSLEAEHLLDPFSLLVLVGIRLPQFLRDPLKLAFQLGITADRLQQILANLEKLEFLKLSDDRRRILDVKNIHLHIPRDHPMMKTHQNLMRSACHERLLRGTHAEGRNFMVTFTSDRQTFEQIQNWFQEFLKRVESVAIKSNKKELYQLNFDLFPWT